MIDKKWKPSEEKYRRNLVVIQSLEEELQFFDYINGQIVIGDGYAVKTYKNWRNQSQDYKEVMQTIRGFLKSGIRIMIKGRYGDKGSYQLIEYNIKDPQMIHYRKLLEKAVEIAYERMKKQAPSEEEAIRIVEEYDSNPHTDLLKDLRDLRFRVGVATKEDTREKLEPKLIEYLRRKEAKLHQYQQGV